jgi:hypothetical protein
VYSRYPPRILAKEAQRCALQAWNEEDLENNFWTARAFLRLGHFTISFTLESLPPHFALTLGQVLRQASVIDLRRT